MTTWTANELDRVGNAAELQLASRRADGTLRPYVTMWVVRAGNDVYVRSAYGPDNPWYRRGKARGFRRGRGGGGGRDRTLPRPAPRARAGRDAGRPPQDEPVGA